MGFQPEWFSGVITSGEIAHGMLSRRSTPLVEALGDTCLHFTWGGRGGISLEVRAWLRVHGSRARRPMASNVLEYLGFVSSGQGGEY
jgi:hypothetical protein